MSATLERLVDERVSQVLARQTESLAGLVASKVVERLEQNEKFSNRKELLTRQEAMELLNVSGTTLWTYVNDKLLHPKKLSANSRRLYFSRSELENLLLTNNGAKS